MRRVINIQIINYDEFKNHLWTRSIKEESTAVQGFQSIL